MKKILAAVLWLGLSSFASAQLFPPGPYGTSSSGTSGGGGGSTTGKINNSTKGSVGFYSVAGSSNVISGDNANFFWDDTNVRLGIGTNAPGTSIDIQSAGQAAVTINSLAGSADYIEFRANGRHTWDFGREIIGGDVGLEWSDVTGGNVDQMKLSQIGDLTLEGLISASSSTFNGVAYNWPGAQGGASTVLQNDGSGNLTWATVSSVSPGGSHTQIQINQNNTFAASSMLTFSTASTGGYMTVATGTIAGSQTALTVGSNGSGKLNMILTAPTGVSAVEKIIRGSNDGGASSLQFSDYPGSNVWQIGMDNGLNTFGIKYNSSTNYLFAAASTPAFQIGGPTIATFPLDVKGATSGVAFFEQSSGTGRIYLDVQAGSEAQYIFSEATTTKWSMAKDSASPPNWYLANSNTGHFTIKALGATDEVDFFGTTGLGTTSGTGTQIYRCSGGTDAGWVLYGNSGAAQTLCTGGGGSLVATGVWLP